MPLKRVNIELANTAKRLHNKAWGRGAAAHPRSAVHDTITPKALHKRAELCNAFSVIDSAPRQPSVRGCAATLGYVVIRLRRKHLSLAKPLRAASD